MLESCPAPSGRQPQTPSSLRRYRHSPATPQSCGRDAVDCADQVALGYRIQRRVRHGEFFRQVCDDEGVTLKAALAAIRLANADADGRLDSGTPGLPCTLDVARERLG